jgi:uracil-DNA glycosylase
LATSRSTGTYPFGAISRSIARIPKGRRDAFILGAYPSALHIHWTPPNRSGRSVQAVAIADEPWAFWDGADQEARVEAWKRKRWHEDWGEATATWKFNGSSGRRLIEHVLSPLGVDPGDAWTTDCLDRYHLSVGMAKAIADVYEASRARLGLPHVSLPTHPSSAAIVARAQRERLGSELIASRPSVVISLGEAAFTVMHSLLAGDRPARLRVEGYGTAVACKVGRRGVTWYPLVHPGQRGAKWGAAHAAWMARRRP